LSDLMLTLAALAQKPALYRITLSPHPCCRTTIIPEAQAAPKAGTATLART